MYNIPSKRHRAEEIVKRSQFIATIAHAASADEANAFVAEIKKEYPDASHNCWAYVAGKPGDTASIGMSDDGEPHGTAGKPMLNVLLHSEVGEIVAVVTRYFGGTKLGPGGMVKAYSGAVKTALEGIELTEKRLLSTLHLTFDYAHINVIKTLITTNEAMIIEEQFESDVRMTIEIPSENSENFIQTVTNITAGVANIFADDN